MIFEFLKFVKPIWYFNLKANGEIPYFLDYNKLDEEHKRFLNLDEAYVSGEASLRDAAWQGIQKGLILKDPGLALDSKLMQGSLPVEDEYRFIKKYFNSNWLWYILLHRLLSLNNPFKEIFSFLKAVAVSRHDLYVNCPEYLDLTAKTARRLKNPPKVSVIIPTLNRYRYLKDALKDLEAQDYPNFEVIIIDQSDPFDENIYKERTLCLFVERQQEKALWKARNRAVEISKGELILLYDDDSRVEADWISEHVRCMFYFDCDISSGVSLSVVGDKVPLSYNYYKWSDQIDTGNVLLTKDVFRKVGLFDRQFEKQRMGDGEFGARAYLEGFLNVSNPKAKRIHLKVSEGGLRQMGSWDGFRPTSFFAPRPVPSVLYFLRRYFGKRRTLRNLMIGIPLSILPYRFKAKKYLLIFYLPLILLATPLILFQAGRSWKIASRMIIEGPKIKKLS